MQTINKNDSFIVYDNMTFGEYKVKLRDAPSSQVKNAATTIIYRLDKVLTNNALSEVEREVLGSSHIYEVGSIKLSNASQNILREALNKR